MSRPKLMLVCGPWVLALCCLGALWVGAGAQSQAPVSQKGTAPSSAPAPGKSMPNGQLYQLEMANGQRVPVFPHDPWAPFEHLTWHHPLTFSVTKVAYQSDQRELLIELDFTVGKESEKRLLGKLVEGYRRAGVPTVDEKAVSLIGLEPVAWSVALEHENRRVELFHSGPGVRSMPTRRVVSYRVPEAPEFDRLHRKLGEAPESVNVLVRGQYEFAKVAGGSVETRVLASAWEAVRERMVGPRGEKPDHEFLVSREGLAEVKKQLRQMVAERVKLHCPKEDFEWVMAQLEKKIDGAMKRLSEPVDVLKLHELGENALVWTVKNGQVEVQPPAVNNLLTEWKEFSKVKQEMVSKAKSLFEEARDDKVKDDQFHQSARKLTLEAEAKIKVKAKLFRGSAKMKLDKSYEELDKHEKEEVHSARKSLQNEQEFVSNFEQEMQEEWKGSKEYKAALAKVLNIHRLSSSAVLAESLGLGQVLWENGVETVAIEPSLPLAPNLGEKEGDTVAGLRKEQRELKGRLEKVEEKLAAAEKNLGQASDKVAALEKKLTDQAKTLKTGTLQVNKIELVDELTGKVRGEWFVRYPGGVGKDRVVWFALKDENENVGLHVQSHGNGNNFLALTSLAKDAEGKHTVPQATLMLSATKNVAEQPMLIFRNPDNYNLSETISYQSYKELKESVKKLLKE